MRNTNFKSSITFHPTKTGSALKESEWAISPFLLAAGLAQVSRKKVEFFFQHHLQNDVFAASVAYNDSEYASYHKSAKVVLKNISIVLNEWYEKELKTYAKDQEEKRASGKKSRKGYRRKSAARVRRS